MMIVLAGPPVSAVSCFGEPLNAGKLDADEEYVGAFIGYDPTENRVRMVVKVGSESRTTLMLPEVFLKNIGLLEDDEAGKGDTSP